MERALLAAVLHFGTTCMVSVTRPAEVVVRENTWGISGALWVWVWVCGCACWCIKRKAAEWHTKQTVKKRVDMYSCSTDASTTNNHKQHQAPHKNTRAHLMTP